MIPQNWWFSKLMVPLKLVPFLGTFVHFQGKYMLQAHLYHGFIPHYRLKPFSGIHHVLWNNNASRQTHQAPLIIGTMVGKPLGWGRSIINPIHTPYITWVFIRYTMYQPFSLWFMYWWQMFTQWNNIYIYSPYSIELIEEFFWASDPEIGCPTNWVMHSRCFLYSFSSAVTSFGHASGPHIGDAHTGCYLSCWGSGLGGQDDSFKPSKKSIKAMSGRTSRTNKKMVVDQSISCQRRDVSFN